MKTRSIRALVGLAISFALPTSGQQTNTVDPQVREQLDALGNKFNEAWNNNDAVALAALFTEDGVLVTNTGPIYGREAIEKHYADLFQKVHFSNYLGKADSRHMIERDGNKAWSNGAWSETIQGEKFGPVQLKGYWSSISVREGDAWKDQMVTWNITGRPSRKHWQPISHPVLPMSPVSFFRRMPSATR